MTLALCAGLPLIAAAIITLAGGSSGRRGVAAIAIAALALTAGAGLAIEQAFAAGKTVLVAEDGHWLPIRGGDLALRVDTVTLPLLVAATAASFVIALTSWRAGMSRSHGLSLLLGTAALVVLITGANLLLVVAASGLMSAATYLATSHDRERPEAAAGAERSFVLDRAGDTAILLASLGYFVLFRTLDLTDIGARVGTATAASAALVAPGLLLVAGALAKAGQVPFPLRAAAVRHGPPGVAAWALLLTGAGPILVLRLGLLLHPGALAVVSGLSAITVVAGALLALSRRGAREALAWAATAWNGATLVAAVVAPGIGVALFVAGSAVISVIAVAAVLPSRFTWRGLPISQDMRRALATGLELEGPYALVGRAYRAAARSLERGTDAALDGVFVWMAAFTLRIGRSAARVERGPAWRMDAIAVAALIALVTYWGLR